MKRIDILGSTAILISTILIGACESEPRALGIGGDDDDGDGSSTARDGEVREQVCDDDGNCYCLKLAVIGTSDSTADDTDVTAFVDWLNTKSSCDVFMFEERTELTENFLADFDIIILQLLADTANGPFWTYSTDELNALRRWIENGGGLISLTGYNGKQADSEVSTINAVLSPVTGITHNNDIFLGTAASEACAECWCWGNSVPIYGWNRDHEISQNVQQVGAFWGYSVNAPEGSVVVATEAGKNAAVAKEIGAGRVFVFADEWVIFSNQWRDGVSNPAPGGNPDASNQCYDVEKQQYNNAENYFQIPQFWYNVIKWVAPPNDCFVIQDPQIVV